MKWFLFTAGCVVALVTLGVLAVDERDVVWEGRQPLCPHCRAEVRFGSVACPDCDRSFDWRSHKEECHWCLSQEDVQHLQKVYRELKEDGPLPEDVAAFGPYFEAIDEGNCTYCGGIGKVMEGTQEMDCPVCRGKNGGRCIACGGSRTVVVGDQGAHQRALERADARKRALERAEVTDLALNVKMLVDEDVAAMKGYVEAEELCDEGGRNLLELAHDRVMQAYRVLHDARARRLKQTEGQ
jgi:hypothetical protein